MQHVNEHLSNRAIRLDGEQFQNCVFQHCTLEIGGTADVVMDGCTILDCQWVFVDAAATTLSVMAKLYAGMVQDGDALMEQTFGYMRRGSGFGRPFTLAGE